ncbi:MAG: Yip1 family protein [Chloroflexota bacterium]
MVDVQQIIGRLMRIARFDHTGWAEIEKDEAANKEAAVVVVGAALLSFIGSLIASLISGTGVGAAFIGLVLGVVLSWLAWSWITMFVGTKLFQADTNFWEMARCIGYANAPQALGLLAFIPCVGALVGIATLILSLVIAFFAIREALDLPTDKTILTIVIGWVIVFVISLVISLVLGGGMALLVR